MRAWRRCLSTSATALSQQQSKVTAAATANRAAAVPLRCRQIFEASKAPATTTSDSGTGPAATSLDNSEIQIKGFVRSVRKQKRWAFAQISDGSTVRPVQAILTPEQAAPYVCSFKSDIPSTWRFADGLCGCM